MKNAILLLIIGLIVCSCDLQKSYRSSDSLGNSFEETPKTAEELRMELLEQEENDPMTYLATEKNYMQEKRIQTRSAGIFRDAEYAPDGALITGYIKNNASIARFKDVVLKLRFYSGTNTVIEEQSYVIYKYFPAGSLTDYSIRIKSFPEAMRNFDVEIVKAASAR